MGGSIKGQDSLLQQQITVKDTTLSVYQAFRLLSGLTHLNFTYSPDMIDLSKRVSINVEDKSLRSVLKGILLDPSLEFRIIGQQLVIFRPLVVKRSTFSIPQDGDSITMLEIRGRVLLPISAW
jgi:hypothetical protein